MADVIFPPGGDGPVNDGERRVLEFLKEALPPHFQLHPNLQISVGLGALVECDIIVLGPDCVWVVEVKDLAGSVKVGEHEYSVNGETRAHPVSQTRLKAQKIKSRLALDPLLHDVWVQPLVVLAREPKLLEVAVPMKAFVVSKQRAAEVIVDPTLVGVGMNRLNAAKLDRIRGRLALDGRARKPRLRYGGYKTVELLSEQADVQWWSATQELMAIPVLLEVVRIDPLLPPEQQAFRRREATRAASVRARVGHFPFLLTPDNVFQADDGSIVVVHPNDPSPSLASKIDELRVRSDDIKRKVIRCVSLAVDLLHVRHVVHRTIGPNSIFVAPSGTAKLGGFSRAAFEGVTGHTVSPADWGALGADFWMSPEHLQGKAGPAADLFALGKLVEYLWPDGAPADLAEAAAVLTSPAIADRTVTAKQVADLAQPAPAAPVGPAGVVQLKEGVLLSDGRYRLEQRIDGGGSGTVWRATDMLSGKAVALKIYRTSDAGAQAMREYQALEDTVHPGVVKVRHFGKMDGHWVLISEFLDGPTLRLAMPPAVEALSLDQSATMCLRVLSALQAIHPDMPRIVALAQKANRSDEEEDELDRLRLNGMTHRDVKPENIILLDGMRPVLVDFGLAASGAVGESGGQPQYRPAGVSPEFSDPDLDLFAVGVILHELLTGRHPYTDDDPVNGRLAVDDGITEGMRAIIERACSPRFDDRFKSAQEFSAALVALGVDEVPVPMPAPDVVELRRNILAAMVEKRWDDAVEMCPTSWVALRDKIEQRRALDVSVDEQPVLYEAEGFSLRFVERRPFRSAMSSSNTEVGPGAVRVYVAAGPAGEVLEILDHHADSGERWVGVGDVFETPMPLARLRQGLRMGLQEAGEGYMAELRQARINGENGWSNLYQASTEELDDGAGVDVGAVLAEFGATGFGSRADVLGDAGRRRNYVCALIPKDNEHAPAVAHLLTKVLPLARGVNETD